MDGATANQQWRIETAARMGMVERPLRGARELTLAELITPRTEAAGVSRAGELGELGARASLLLFPFTALLAGLALAPGRRFPVVTALGLWLLAVVTLNLPATPLHPPVWLPHALLLLAALGGAVRAARIAGIPRPSAVPSRA
ncbi:MAG: hypothetical protein AB1635_05570 [Acidobacteriota bacterium]